jgi:outer membrane protein
MKRALLLSPAFALALFAQEKPLTLKQAVETAAERYPSIRVSAELISEAAAGINLARTAFLPRADFIAQANRATANNIFGLTFPNTILPPISGPQIQGDQTRSAFSTATGILVSWEPFDFGRRQAEVDAAATARTRAEAAAAKTRLDVSAATADAYLTVLAAEKTVEAARAGVTRYEEFEKVTAALSRADLRPGADLARIRAEAVVARTQLIRAEQAVASAKALLAQYTGDPVATNSAFLTSNPPSVSSGLSTSHPVLAEQQRAIEEVVARLKVLDKSWYPRFNAQAAAFGRGSGARIEGPFAGAANGLYPNTGNWALGFTATFPILEYKTLRARKEIELQRQRREDARKELLQRELSGRLGQAQAQLEGARRVAQIAPDQAKALATIVDQAQARYKAGLGTLLEVADAQRQLIVAEIDAALASLAVWRAELAVAYAQGDLAPFLERIP